MGLNDIHLVQIVSILIKVYLIFCDGISGSGSGLCQEPPPVPNAYRGWTRGDMVPDIMNYTCYTNHELVSGDLVRHCNIFGVYSGEEPNCKLNCNVPRHIEGSTVTYPSTLSSLNSPSFLNYECLPGLVTRGSGKYKCDVNKRMWSSSKIDCYNDTENIAEGSEAYLWDGTNIDHVVDGDNTCRPVSDTNIDIHLNDTYKIIKISITYNIAEINKIALSAIQTSPWTDNHCHVKNYDAGIMGIAKNVFSFKNFGSTKCVGDIVRIEITTPTNLSICDIKIYGNLFIGDCGQPPVLFGQTVDYTNTTEGSTAMLSCVPPSYPSEGHGVITCQKTKWTPYKLKCTMKPNLAEVTPDTINDMALDDNYTTCEQIISVDGNPSEWSVDLGQDYEIYTILVTIGDMDLTQYIKAEIVSSSGKATVCQYKRSNGVGVVVPFQCSNARLGQIVKLYAGDVLNLCDVKVQGRYYDEPMECHHTFRGKNYKGKQNVSIHGHSCVSWASIPAFNNHLGSFPDYSYDDIGNNCRNPSNTEISPWCFISQTEWQHCSVPHCDKICLRTPDGLDYKGNIAKSASNKLCKEWSLKVNNDRFYYELPSNNYCGNQRLDQSKPWCIVEDGFNIAYEHCNIPECPKSSDMTTMTLSPQSIDSQFLSNVFQCFYNTGSEEIYFHTNFTDVFNLACSMTNETRIIYLCSFLPEEWKIVEYFCDPVPVSSESIESTSADVDTTSMSESVTGLLSELTTTAFIDPTSTYNGSIIFESVSEATSTSSVSIITSSEAILTISEAIPTSSEAILTNSDAMFTTSEDIFTISGAMFTSSDVLIGSFSELSTQYQLSDSDVLMSMESFSELSTHYQLSDSDVLMSMESFSELSTRYQMSDSDVLMSMESFSELSIQYQLSDSDDLMSTESFSELSTNQLPGSESCGTSNENVLCPTSSGVSNYVTETVTSTQLVSRSCKCYCRSKPLPNMTDPGTTQLSSVEMARLILNKTKLSRTFRKKNSIHDSRTFAIALGSVGVFIIIGSALFLASSDFSRVFMGTANFVRRIRANTHFNSYSLN